MAADGVGWSGIVKRMVDVTASLLTLLLLWPLLLVITICIKLDSPGPVIFCSRRLGRNGRPFTIYKFRTMYVNSPPLHAADGSLLVLPHDRRVTPLGRVLRLGLDELPQIVNVLLGQMSLVGPRADPPEAQHYYMPADYRRLAMRPGITGLAQVNGRAAMPLVVRRTYDLAYVDRWSPRVDSCIALLTVFELAPFLRRPGRRLCRWLMSATHEAVGIRAEPATAVWGGGVKR